MKQNFGGAWQTGTTVKCHSAELLAGAWQVPIVQTLESSASNYSHQGKQNGEQGKGIVTPIYLVSKCSYLPL